VARTVNNILKVKCISFVNLARKVAHMKSTHVRKLLINPTPWPQCREYKKRIYLKLHRWSQSSEAVNELAGANLSRGFRAAFEATFRRLPDVPAGVELDTQHVVQTLVRVLEAKRIANVTFAHECF
jgi:hypothetical protein